MSLTQIYRAAVGLALVLAGCAPDGLGKSRPNFHVIGHHGAPNLVPENTLPSFRTALSLGANALEADVCLTRDNVLVLFHDRDPDDSIALIRQAGGEGLTYIPSVPAVGSEWRRPVEQLTLSELRAHYGYQVFGGSELPGVEIPTLEQFLDLARSEPALTAVYLDFKLLPEQLGAIVPWVFALGSDPTLARVQFFLLSVHSEIVVPLEAERVRTGFDSPRVAHDSEEPSALDETLADGVRDVSVGFTPNRTWSGFLSETADAVRAREGGKVDSVMAWTIDRDTELAELIYYSVDGIITNDVALLRSEWERSLH